jgi:predicted ABC-type ATPase
VVILAGPNGAGKSTVAPALLRGALAVTGFVDADVIARELSDSRESFAFETTLASRSFARWLRHLRKSGYEIHILFL